MKIHAIQTGSLVGNSTFFRGDGFGALLRRRDHFEFPCLAFVVEHPDGLIAIDTGMGAHMRPPAATRRFVPRPVISAAQEIGPRMRDRGLDPDDVRLVVVTHLDWDHVGGVRHFPNAEVLVHRSEWEFSRRLLGRMRYQPEHWPDDFSPTVYELDGAAIGPFPNSRRVAEGISVVPLAGHSAGQVGVLVENGDTRLFGADHVLRQDWFTEDWRAGRLLGQGQFFPDDARESSRRIAALAVDRPTVLALSHDTETAGRLEAMEPLRLQRAGASA